MKLRKNNQLIRKHKHYWEPHTLKGKLVAQIKEALLAKLLDLFPRWQKIVESSDLQTVARISQPDRLSTVKDLVKVVCTVLLIKAKCPVTHPKFLFNQETSNNVKLPPCLRASKMTVCLEKTHKPLLREKTRQDLKWAELPRVVRYRLNVTVLFLWNKIARTVEESRVHLNINQMLLLRKQSKKTKASDKASIRRPKTPTMRMISPKTLKSFKKSLTMKTRGQWDRN